MHRIQRLALRISDGSSANDHNPQLACQQISTFCIGIKDGPPLGLKIAARTAMPITHRPAPMIATRKGEGEGLRRGNARNRETG